MVTLPWYHRTTIYQAYLRSFYDHNGDGIGDLPGLLDKLDYIASLGFETIWVSPFFASPQADWGYDVSSYTEIAPEYGDMRDVDRMIEEVHRRGMRIVLDLVLNHTSNQHPWFLESRSSRDNPLAEWYLWRDTANSWATRFGIQVPPTNWQCMTGGSGWHYVPERNQYYWASFLPFQPDLNYRNPEVKQAMFDVVRYWLNRRVDGFRLDIFNMIYKDSRFRNNPFSFKLVPSDDDPSGFLQQARYTANLPESFQLAKEVRTVCNEFGDRLVLGEVTGDRRIVRSFLGDTINDGLTLIFDFAMMRFDFTAVYFRDLIRSIEASYRHPFMPVYAFSNHDKHRSMHRLAGDVAKAKLLHLLQFTVRGVPCVYQGEELGMTNASLSYADARDPTARKYAFLPRALRNRLGMLINRDEVRTPMQWDGTRNSGFTLAPTPWLPVHPNHVRVNVADASVEPRSLLNTIRALTGIRAREPALQHGTLELLQDTPANILGYMRAFGDERVVVLLNFGSAGAHLRLPWVSDVRFRLFDQDGLRDGVIQLGGLGGVILKLL